MKYRIVKYKTLTGIQEFVDLGDQAYGEWIVYINNFPKFHINCFRENSDSDVLIKKVIEKKNWTIEKLIDLVNENENIKLSLGTRPWIEIESSTELREITLEPLPYHWIEKIN